MSKPRYQISEDDAEAVKAVAYLHSIADFIRNYGYGPVVKRDCRDIRDAAALLDRYRAGLSLVAPHAVTQAELIQWVSVEDAMPPQDELVVVFGPAANYVRVAVRDGSNWSQPTGFDVPFDPTHWAALPKGPQALPVAPDAIIEETAA